MGSNVHQISTDALLGLAQGLGRHQAQKAAERAARERTALVLGVEAEEVTQPLSVEYRWAVGAA